MSKYTTELRYICESEYSLINGSFDRYNYSNIEEIIENVRNIIFDFSYPIFDENYRKVLECKILKTYYTREICEETFGLWKLRLNARMNNIMPYYNKLYKSELIEFNPLYDTDYKEVHSGSLKTDDDYTKTNVNKYLKIENEEYKNDEENTEIYREDNDLSEVKTNERNITDTDRKNETTNREQNTTTDNTNTETKTENKTTNNTINYGQIINYSGTQTETDNEVNKYSDTPQGGLTNLLNNEYLTDARIIDTSKQLSDINTTTNSGSDTTRATENITINGSNVLDGDENITEELTYTTNNLNTIEDTDEENITSNRDITSNKTNTKTIEYNKDFNSEANDNLKEENKRDISTTDEYINSITGKRNSISYSKMLLEFRETFLNIDLLIINELSDLFMLLY